MKPALVALAQGRDAARRSEGARRQTVAQVTTGTGQDKVFDSTVGRMRLPLYQTTRLQAVDQARDVGRVAFQARCQVSHREGPFNIQLTERHRLSGSELEFGRGRAQMAVDPIDRDAHKQRPHLIGEAGIGSAMSGNTVVHARIVIGGLVESLGALRLN